MKAVMTENVSKIYTQGKKAVNGMSFSLEKGEVFGLLGPNGSGKTTTVKLLNGMLTPTEGTCRVFDRDPAVNPEQVHQLSGVVTEHAQMYDTLTGLDNLIFFGMLFGISATESARRARGLLEQLDLAGAQDRKLETYSTGMRQRLSLARAMLHRPKILFLDEPTSGLDPESALSVNTLIKDLAQNSGTTIFLCTHQLRYAEEICNKYGLIDEGVLFACGNLEKLRSLVFSGMTVRMRTDLCPKDIPAKQMENQYYEVTVCSEEEIPSIVKGIVQEGGNVYHVSARSLSLEEIYFSLLEKRAEKKAKKKEVHDD